MPDRDDEDLPGMLGEFLEAQRAIDKMARETLENLRKMLDHQERLAPARVADFTDHEPDFYRRTARELDAEGFRDLGAYDDPQTRDRPASQRSYYGMALHQDGTVAASYFAVPTPPDRPNLRCLVLHSWSEDGRTAVTTHGITDYGLPYPPGILVQAVPGGTRTRDAVRKHRERAAGLGPLLRLRDIEEILSARDTDNRAISAFRRARGPALCEPWLRALLGDEYEEQGQPIVEAILAHPEWWTGEQAATPPVKLTFLMSQDGASIHFTTLGLLLTGLPELQMKQVAPNHCRAARFLMGVVAEKLRRLRGDAASGEELFGGMREGVELTLTRDDVSPLQPYVSWGRYPEVTDPATPVAVRLVLEHFGEGEPDDAELLTVLPPSAFRGESASWLRSSCRALGQDAPAPLAADAFESAMQAASQRARARLPAIRERFTRGLPAGQTLAAKTGLETTTGGREYVWIRVTEWKPDGMLAGTLETEPHDCPGYREGQTMRIPESDVFDYAIGSPEGMIEIALTDLVAQEFGAEA